MCKFQNPDNVALKSFAKRVNDRLQTYLSRLQAITSRHIEKFFNYSNFHDMIITAPGWWPQLQVTEQWLACILTMILLIEFNDREELLLPKSIFARKLVENYTDFFHCERLMRYTLCVILNRFHAAIWAKTWENDNSETHRNLRKQYWPDRRGVVIISAVCHKNSLQAEFAWRLAQMNWLCCLGFSYLFLQ
jgi:hypothetical protein